MIAAMILILLVVTLAVLHYTPSGRKHFSVQDIVAIVVLIFLALCFISLGICIKRRNRVLPYRQLQSDIGVIYGAVNGSPDSPPRPESFSASAAEV